MDRARSSRPRSACSTAIAIRSSSRGDIERPLQRYLGVETIVWLGQGVHLDETDGHVDNLCAFVRPGEVVLTWTDDRRDPQYEISRDAWERLAQARDARGRRFKVHKLHQPAPLYMTKTEAVGIDAAEGTQPREARMRDSRVPTSISTWATGGWSFRCSTRSGTAAALRKLVSLFPRREVVGVPGREILLGGGNIHCITQQVPRRKTGGARRRAGTRSRK